ncbi:MAG: hypothetical protein SCAL_000294 [Candidatus Syntrophoarchaeum caldarius]|uniref:Uncharacterized protein n=1 Tax=Candidatus Syntropharchaeum caldarium TaxID=1838285 RepID=A0A1F2PBK7_9EURY|nr:MAG: hypothetical protein SCAL_000294 [Candidatus Syntrophoarchaeum caldarius]
MISPSYRNLSLNFQPNNLILLQSQPGIITPILMILQKPGYKLCCKLLTGATYLFCTTYYDIS